MSGPNRILYLIDGLEGDGAERQFCELVRGVFDHGEFEPHVGVLERKESGHAWMLEERGISVNEFARRSRFDLRPIKEIISYIRTNNIALVHAYMSMGSEFGLIAAKYCRIPVITSSIRNGRNRDWKERVRTYYQARFADMTIANSRTGLTSRFSKIRSSYRVIYNGFNLDRFAVAEEDRESLRDELGLSGEERLVCMAARLEPQKDHLTLLRAVELVKQTHPQLLLLVAGQGQNLDLLEDYCAQHGLAQHVRFIGHRRDVETVVSICEVSVLLTNTTIHLEGISNTIIESMALGVPVLATSGGGTNEIFGNADCGGPPYEFGIKVAPHDHVEVANGLIYLLEDDIERTKIGNAGKKMVLERFNNKRFIDENLSVYHELNI